MGSDGKSAAYDGLATVGRVDSFFNLVIIHIVAIILFIVSIWLMQRKRRLTNVVSGVVTDTPDCTGSNCTVTYTYELNSRIPGASWNLAVHPDGVMHEGTFLVSRSETRRKVGDGPREVSYGSIPYQKSQTVNVYYDPADPQGSASLSNDDWRGVAWGLFGFAILLLGFGWLHWYLVQRFKPLAALQGTATSVHLLTSALR